ncbi:MAG: hypothetical protein JW885_09935 [Deltaproteobacteria bacterium]|nr:hypothetical protein [Candidatus Zymogenaceae bacterium]
MSEHSGEKWEKGDEKKLKRMANSNVPTKVIAKELGRTEQAIYNKASELGVSLKPKDK